MKQLIKIERELHKYGIDHTVIIKEHEVVVCDMKEIPENVIIREYGALRLEMLNGVETFISMETLTDYIKESARQRVEEAIVNVIESRYPNQEISGEEISNYFNDDAFLTKYISGCKTKIHMDYKL